MQPTLWHLRRGSAEFAEVGRHLLTIEREATARQFKVGVLYAKPGQTTENEFFGNGAWRP
jgi:hypothetical protein